MITKPSLRRLRRVSILINRTAGRPAGLVTGIGQFIRGHGGWVVQRRDASNAELERVKEFEPEGVIADIDYKELAERVAALGVPLINVGTQPFLPEVPWLGPDWEEVVALQANHLYAQGFRDISYGCSNRNAFAIGMDRVVEALAVKLKCRYRTLNLAEIFKTIPYKDWNLEIARQLSALPLPTSIITTYSSDAVTIVQRCREVGIEIPEQIILSTVNDEQAALDLAHPPLTAVEVPWSQIGFQAAQNLQTLLDDGETERSRVFPPAGITVRRSTSAIAVEDPALVRALQFIRENAAQRMTVQDVADHAGLSRRILEKRFRQELNRSPFDEIRHQQVEKVRELLVETDLPLEEIVDRSAFANSGHLSEAFVRLMNVSPGRFRRRFRRR